MHAVLQSICGSLEDLADSIKKSHTETRAMNEIWNWTFPALSRLDLANIATNLANKIKQYDLDDLSPDYVERLHEIPNRITLYKEKSLPHLFDGNGNQSAPVLMSLMNWISVLIEPLYSWEILKDNRALPNNLARRLRSVQAELATLIPEKEVLKEQIRLIKEATDAAETLPTDLESLKEARNKVGKLSTDSAEYFGKIDSYLKEIEKASKHIIEKTEEANKLVSQCEEAYKITTTKGLAAAFDQRAKKLSTSMWIWVLGLVISLAGGALIGSSRYEILVKSLQVTNPQWGVIWMDFFLSIIGLAAPIWFAWLATKQISQRFKLSEDYAFKASVAKAYEGYRREAARIDEDFEARLFSSALSRLEEAPLRFVENDNHGSPWHEFFNSESFKKALDTIPNFKDKFYETVKGGFKNIKKLSNNGKQAIEE